MTRPELRLVPPPEPERRVVIVLDGGRQRRPSPAVVCGRLILVSLAAWLVLAAVVFGLYQLLGWLWP